MVRVKQVFNEYNRKAYNDDEPFRYCPLCGSALTVCERGGRKRTVCSVCQYVHYKNPYPGVVVLIEREGMILLGRRLGTYGRGKWCIPGGYIEYEEDFLTAAHREIREETGLDIEVKLILSVATNFLSPERHTLVVALLAHVIGGNMAAGDDIAELKWFPIGGALPDMAFPSDMHIIDRYCRTKFNGAPVDIDFAVKADKIKEIR